MYGSTMYASTMYGSSLYISSIDASTITASTMTISQNISISSINYASYIETRMLEFSSIRMIPATISTNVGPATGSIHILIGGIQYLIPIIPA